MLPSKQQLEKCNMFNEKCLHFRNFFSTSVCNFRSFEHEKRHKNITTSLNTHTQKTFTFFNDGMHFVVTLYQFQITMYKCLCLWSECEIEIGFFCCFFTLKIKKKFNKIKHQSIWKINENDEQMKKRKRNITVFIETKNVLSSLNRTLNLKFEWKFWHSKKIVRKIYF